MADHSEPTNLAVSALAYVCGELSPQARAAFERRLADDPAACEALSEAVQLLGLLDGQTPMRPTPAYRVAVRHRLAPPAAPGRLTGSSAWWQSLGVGVLAVLAVCVCLAWPVPQPQPQAIGQRFGNGQDSPRLPSMSQQSVPVRESTVTQTTTAAPQPATHQPDPDELLVSVWADLSNSEHLQKARLAHQRRQQRITDRDTLADPTDRRYRRGGSR
jgi:anti-sigma factor RsiW